MKYIPIIIIVALFLACGNGKGGKNNEPYDGGHGIRIAKGLAVSANPVC